MSSPTLPAQLNPRGADGASGRAGTPGGAGRPGGPSRPQAPRAGRRPPTRLSRIARRLLTVVALMAAAAVVVASVSGYGLLTWSSRSIHRVDAFAGLTHRPPPSAAGSTTYLLVGSDGRTGMTTADMKRLHVGTAATAGGRRADTMLLVHVSARHGTVDVVSLPRDSYVTIPAHVGANGAQVPEHRNKLNAAYAFGGPALTVATVERTTGVRVDHYLEVDFLGFVRLVDAVGGVDVCSPTPMRDRKAGLRLPAGVSHVNGETGLSYVRARHLDGRADLGRVERQQRFLAAMVSRATGKDVLLDPRALVRFLNAALASVRADPGLNESELVRLGTRLRHVSGGDVRFRTVPVANPSMMVAGEGSVALWDTSAADAVFASMRDDSARATTTAAAAHSRPTVPPAQIRLQVYNGTARAGLGSIASADLAARGFETAGLAQNWRSTDTTRTIIRFDARWTQSIKTVAASLPGSRLVAVAGLGPTMQVVIGSSYAGAKAVTVTAPELAGEGSAGVTAAGASGFAGSAGSAGSAAGGATGGSATAGVRTAGDHVCN